VRPRQASTPDGAQSDAENASGPDLQGLMGRASAALHMQCDAAHQELEQTQRLLNDATRRLLDAFHAANRELASLGREAAAERVERNLFAASQHLQFSDLVGQLLANTEQRVDALLQVSQRLQDLVLAMQDGWTGPEASAAGLAGERVALLKALAALESCGHSSVRQLDMKAGGVDLF
jgi:hypothetical protein